MDFETEKQRWRQALADAGEEGTTFEALRGTLRAAWEGWEMVGDVPLMEDQVFFFEHPTGAWTSIRLLVRGDLAEMEGGIHPHDLDEQFQDLIVEPSLEDFVWRLSAPVPPNLEISRINIQTLWALFRLDRPDVQALRTLSAFGAFGPTEETMAAVGRHVEQWPRRGRLLDLATEGYRRRHPHTSEEEVAAFVATFSQPHWDPVVLWEREPEDQWPDLVEEHLDRLFPSR